MRLLATMFLAFGISAQAVATEEIYNGAPVLKSVQNDFEQGRLIQRTEFVINLLVRKAALELRLLGKGEEADQLLAEWKEQRSKHFVFNGIDELGDFEPFNDWLAEKTAKLEEMLGEKIMRITRLMDLKTVNYGIPVVFNPKDERWDIDEYRLHFVPFAGVVTYWSTYSACSAATYGSGVVLVCPIAGYATEKVMVRFVAEGLSDRVYNRRTR